MILYISICIIIVFIAILVGLYVFYYNKYQVSKIKINEADSNIKLLLDKKLDLLLEINNFLKEKKKNLSLDGIEEIDKFTLNSFELNDALSKFNKTIIELTDYNIDIKLTDNEKIILKEIEESEIECLASIHYYNDNVVGYNEMLSKFPSNIVGKILKCDKKDFYTNKKEEIFEILKK